MIRCVLFDLDGTLVDTWDLYVEAYIRTLEPHVGRRLTLAELTKLGPVSELRLLRRALSADAVEAAHREFLRHYQSLHPTLFGGVYPGVREMLEALRRRALPLGIVTGKSRAAWEVTAKETDLGAFDSLVTDEEVSEAKPAPEGLSLAIDRLGVSANEAVFVGDSLGDARASRAAGIRFAAALWPKGKHELADFRTAVREVGIWAELRNPEGLVALLEEFSD